MPVSLVAIRQMIKNRQYEDARSALQAFLRQNPKSAEGWYLLSLAGETTPKRLAAARRAAKLAPKNVRVLARLDQLQKSPKALS
jgi:cytochrome c-type biogenesis protein CcmH/NrfG